MSQAKEQGRLVDLDSPYSPAVLAGILKINVQMVYQGVQDGKLPANKLASYAECIHHYIEHYKGHSKKKLGEIGALKTLQETRNLKVVEELKLLEIGKLKGELLEKEVLTRTFQPIFSTFSQGLIAITKNYPETSEEIRKLLKSWATIGEHLEKLATEEVDNYLEDELEKRKEEIEIVSAMYQENYNKEDKI